ncbi:MAG: ATP-binding protein [bacterium]
MQWRKLILRPQTITLLIVMVMLLVALTVATWSWAEHARERLATDFSKERLRILELVANDIEEDMQDLIDDLRLARRLIHTSTTRDDLRRPLIALLGTARAFRALVLLDSRQRLYLTVVNPRRPFIRTPDIDAALRKTAVRALQAKPHEVKISPPVTRGKERFRIFATSNVRSSSVHPARVVALVVDMRSRFGKLRLASMTRGTELLILGPDGDIASASKSRLVRALRRAKSSRSGGALLGLVKNMRLGRRGTVRIPESEAKRLKLGDADMVAAYLPIRIRGSVYWSVATVTNMAELRRHEKALVQRLGAGALAIALLVVAFGAFVLRSSFHQAVLRERVRGATEIAHLHEKARKILESIPTGVLVLGDQDLVSDLNGAMRRWLPDFVPGTPLAETFPAASESTVARLTRLVEQAREIQETTSLVGERLSLFGAAGHYRVHAVPLTPPLTEARVLLVVEDVTELKSLENQLLRTEKLSTIGTLAAGIAHEIGTPLTVVRGRSEYVLKNLGPDHPETSSLRTVIDQTDRIARTVRELLDFSRTEPAQVAAVPLQDLAEKSVDLLRYEAERRGITVSVELPAVLPPLSAGVDQLQQVLVNLLLNAFDASPPGGKVRLLASPQPLENSTGGKAAVRIEIHDQGSGIPPEVAHRIFDPFYTTKKPGQGTGLGLFIVAQILRNHGAELRFDSEPERGTWAILTWPTHPEEHDAQSV